MNFNFKFSKTEWISMLLYSIVLYGAVFNIFSQKQLKYFTIILSLILFIQVIKRTVPTLSLPKEKVVKDKWAKSIEELEGKKHD